MIHYPTLLASIRIGGALPIRLEAIEGDLLPSGAVETWVRFTVTVPNVHDPSVTVDVHFTQLAPANPTEAEALDWIRSWVVWFYRHEAEEQICYQGRRPFYPAQDHAP
jgi:hypothetical protein